MLALAEYTGENADAGNDMDNEVADLLGDGSDDIQRFDPNAADAIDGDLDQSDMDSDLDLSDEDDDAVADAVIGDESQKFVASRGSSMGI